jgi:predicted glycosyltransferase involved in capsule biosynthesis
VDFGQRSKQLLERLFALIKVLQGTEFSLTIGHADRHTGYDIELKRRFNSSEFSYVRLVSVRPQTKDVELARLRNMAMQEVDEEIVLLLDVDIYPDLDLFRSLTGAVNAGDHISMAPCIYLSSVGNNLLRTPEDVKRVVDNALVNPYNSIMHWALPSSVMSFRRSDYWAIGGFHEEYRGHGYEDFDFMLRFAISKGLIKPSDDLLIDCVYRAPLLASGFRAELGRLCIPNLFDGKIAIHLHHGNYKNSSYRKRRVKNAEIFKQRIREYLVSKVYIPSDEGVPEIIKDFFGECKRRGVSPDRFHTLFDTTPRFQVNRRPWWMRINRALAQFF